LLETFDMKKLLCLVFVLVVLGAIPAARSLGTPPLPPNISADNWIPLGDAAGFVITRSSFAESRPAAGTIKGYFVVRQGNRWLRVDSRAELEVQPTAMR
jgi:hypothetical protein